MIQKLVRRLKELSDYFKKAGILDIYTNSKIFEMVIAEYLGHRLINGHRNSSDAEDSCHNYYEYKHFKLSSSNHSWTFNDFSPNTIDRLDDVKEVIFAVIDDKKVVPRVQKMYIVPASEVKKYLLTHTASIHNQRSMINISATQIVNEMDYTCVNPPTKELSSELTEVFSVISKLERRLGVSGILTSNKLWELLVALRLGHQINPEQKAHDACDQAGNTYEYKVSTKYQWVFQDISENVLKKYLTNKAIILAVVDKRYFTVAQVYMCDPVVLVRLLREKLDAKERKHGPQGRKLVSLGKKDLRGMASEGGLLWIH